MPDVVVTVPKALWWAWLNEGDLPGDPWSKNTYDFYLYGNGLPDIEPGERVYIVAHGRLRGYAPLVRINQDASSWGGRQFSLVRHGGAVAVTIDRPIRGFRGWRYVDWDRSEEHPFPDWKTEGVTDVD